MTHKEEFNQASMIFRLSAREYINYLREAMLPSYEVVKNASEEDYKRALELLARDGRE